MFTYQHPATEQHPGTWAGSKSRKHAAERPRLGRYTGTPNPICKGGTTGGAPLRLLTAVPTPAEGLPEEHLAVEGAVEKGGLVHLRAHQSKVYRNQTAPMKERREGVEQHSKEALYTPAPFTPGGSATSTTSSTFRAR